MTKPTPTQLAWDTDGLAASVTDMGVDALNFHIAVVNTERASSDPSNDRVRQFWMDLRTLLERQRTIAIVAEMHADRDLLFKQHRERMGNR